MIRACCLVLLVYALLPPPANSAPRVYRIGNSLTWDSQPKSIEALARLRSLKHVEGYHINCGKSLGRIWSHPDEVCVDPVAPYGKYSAALPNHDWDAVTLQPHPGENSTLASDTARIVNFIALAQSKGRNKQTAFYIYAAWPRQQELPFDQLWKRSIAESDNQPTARAEEYFDHLLARVRSKSDATLRVIPVGAVLYELDQQMQAGRIEGYASADDLYRDRAHLNNVGRYIAGVTTLATLYGQDPQGLKCPADHYGGGKQLSPALYQTIHETIWRVLTRDAAATGVTQGKPPTEK